MAEEGFARIQVSAELLKRVHLQLPWFRYDRENPHCKHSHLNYCLVIILF
jgi:hypothetical protein